MNKKELIGAVAKQAGMSNADAARAVDTVLKVITKTLNEGGSVSLPGFGTFTVRKSTPRMGRNPRTGAVIKIQAAKTPSFKSGRELRRMVKKGTDDPGPSNPEST